MTPIEIRNPARRWSDGMSVHWPTGVLSGWTAGAAWARICLMVARWLRPRGALRRAESPPLE